MDEYASRPETDGGSQPAGEDRPTGADRLVNRLAELRGQLDLVAPEDQRRGREAVERMFELHERVASLGVMLTAARGREHDLTVQTVRDGKLLAEYEARIAELETVVTDVSTADEARRQAESVAGERAHALTAARADVEALRAETEKLRARCEALEADLRAVADELAAGSIARAQAPRLERERDEALRRAEAERALAAADRLRAADAEARAKDLQEELLRGAERVTVPEPAEQRAEPPGPAEAEPPAAPEPPPWVTLQRRTDAAPTSIPAKGGPARSDVGANDVIDLTDPDESADPQQGGGGSNGNPGATDHDGAWASSSQSGLFGKVLHPRRHR